MKPKEMRCPNCGRKLLEIANGSATIIIKCAKCKTIVTLDTTKIGN